MERLYAVPSEKLRVWMVWLTGVSEIADEWHKWLRAHIDLIARIAEQRLQTVANNPGASSKKIESDVSISLNLARGGNLSNQCCVSCRVFRLKTH